MVHRDIKCANILIDNQGYAKICDYGLSKFLIQGEKTRTFLGTMQYVSPEMLGSYGYDHSVDLWSLAVSCYELVFGFTPFEPEDQNLLQDNWVEQLQRNIRSPYLNFSKEVDIYIY